MTTARIATTLLLAGALGCAGTQPRPASAPGADKAQALPADVREALSARAQRLFSEAVQAQEEQRKLKVPTDWALLERKWRAAVDVEEVAEARFNLAVAEEAQGRLGEARADYERALATKPGLRQAAVNLGVLLEKQGDLRGAQAAYAGVVRDFPDDALARERLAAMYQASGQQDEAWRFAREALLRDARSVGAYKILAGVSLQRGNLDIARLITLRAAKLDPADPEIPFLAGQVLDRQGDHPAAAVQYRKALSLDEGFMPARRALLQAAVAGKRWAGVAEHAPAVLKEEPRNGAVHLALGIAQRHLGKPDEALASYARAEESGGGKLAEVHLARGVLLMREKEQCEPALEEFRTYGRLAGPVATTSSNVLPLQRECEQVVAENRKAAEMAKAMKAEAERKAAEAAARKAAAAAPKAAAPAAATPAAAAPSAATPASATPASAPPVAAAPAPAAPDAPAPASAAAEPRDPGEGAAPTAAPAPAR